MARVRSLALVDNFPRDGVLMKIMVVVVHNHNLNMSDISLNNALDNSMKEVRTNSREGP